MPRSAGSGDAPFGRRLRQLRESRGLSTRGLAELAHYSKSYVNDLERGARAPTEAAALRLDDKLGARGDLAGRAGFGGPAPPSRPDAGEPLGEADVNRMHHLIRHLVALDTLHGSAGLAPAADRAFRTIRTQLGTAGVRPGMHADVRSALAELGEVTAWLAYDSELHDLSRRAATEALLIAQSAGDSSMSRFVLSQLALQALHLGRPTEALALVSRVTGDEPRSRRVAAMLQVRRAGALGALGDTAEALRELTRARAELGTGVGPDDPAWSWWLHSAELAGHEATIRAAGGDLAGAIAAAEEAVLLMPSEQGRDQALFRARLLSYLVDAQAWREAGWIAADLAIYAAGVGSARVPAIVRQTERRAIRDGAPTWLLEALRAAADAADPAA